MKTLREYIQDAREGNYAIGHFNFSTIEGLRAIRRGAEKIGVPVIVGVSEGERDFVGVHTAVALVREMREGEGYPIFLNADHTYSYERVKEAIDAGFDAVIFDGTALSYEENVRTTKECVAHARQAPGDVLVEGELGYIGTSSKVLDSLPDGVSVSVDDLTTPEEAMRYVKETGVDLFSPAIGSVHGMLRKSQDPDLHIARIREIATALSLPLVLHGASGLRDANVVEAVKNGISIMHVNTELRVAWQNALKLFLQEHPEEVAPYKILKGSEQAMAEVVFHKLTIIQ